MRKEPIAVYLCKSCKDNPEDIPGPYHPKEDLRWHDDELYCEYCYTFGPGYDTDVKWNELEPFTPKLITVPENIDDILAQLNRIIEEAMELTDQEYHTLVKDTIEKHNSKTFYLLENKK